ncbi:MAG: HEAT repeat domain-containing protein [Gemmataceae bacterium]
MTHLERAGAIGPDAKEAVPGLVSHLNDDKDRFARGACARTLARIGVKDNKTLTALKKALADSNTIVQIEAAEALTALDLDNQDAIMTLIKLLKDKDHGTRFEAANSLGSPRGCFKSCKIKLVIPPLVIALKDSDEEVRLIAAQSLGNICEDSERVVPALIERVNNEKRTQPRIFAIQALGEYGPEAKAAIPALTRALKEGDQEVQAAAAQSINHIKTWKNKRGQKGKEEKIRRIKKMSEDVIKKYTWFWER